MTPFKHLLVATDLSECSQQAIDLATRLALDGQAQLTLVHVLEVPTYAYASDPMLVVDLFTPLREIAQKRLDESLERLRRQVPLATGLLGRGPPWSELLKIAEEKGCDLLVLGTHGHHGVSRLMLGSVAEKVVRMANVPVLTVRVSGPARAPAGGAT